MRKAAAYLRVSTCYQTTSLEAQERDIRRFCEYNNIEELTVYSDFAISGTKTSRPALDTLLEDSKLKKFDTVIVYSFSRFARSVKHLLSALEYFEDNDIEFISTSENVQTKSAIGKAIFTILAATAALERDVLSERVKLGLRNAKANGKQIGRPKTRPSKMIRELRSRGKTYKAISESLNCSIGSVAKELNDFH